MVKEKQKQNVSQDEVNKFNELSEYWWDPEGPLKTLHQVQPTRMRFIHQQCDLTQKTIIDVGCGGGILTESLALASSKVVGIDLAPDSLNIAKLHAKPLETPPTYIQVSAEEHAKAHTGEYDVVTCLELIEHVPSPSELLKALSNLMKPGGDLFISTLNRTPKSYLMTIIGAEYLLNLIPKGTHDYKAFIKPSELNQEAKKYGLRLKALKGIQYRMTYQDFVLSSDCSVNYIAHFCKD